MSSVNIVDTTSPDGLAIQGNDEDIDPEEDDELAERLRLGIPKDADICKIVIFFRGEFYLFSGSLCAIGRIHVNKKSLCWVDFYHCFGILIF